MRIASTRSSIPAKAVIATIFTAIGIGVAVIGFGTVTRSVELAFANGMLSPTLLAIVLPFAAWSFGLRIIRWHLLARRVVPSLPLRVSAYTHVIGFAFSATPGRVAELYKLKLLEEATAVPAARSLPAALVERITDVIAFASLVVVGSAIVWTDDVAASRTIDVALAVLSLGGLIAFYVATKASRSDGTFVRRFVDATRHRLMPLVPRIPGGRRGLKLLEQVRSGGTLVATPSTIGIAIACVVLGRFGDSFVLWKFADAAGVSLSFPLAALMIGSAGFVGGITLSPGGLGAAEATLVGIVVAQGVPIGTAVLIALATRTVIFWFWVALGLLVFTIHQGRNSALRSKIDGGIVQLGRLSRNFHE